MTRKEILDAAEKCVNGSREQDYGTPENNFHLIAGLWNAYLSAACMGQGGKFTGIAVQDVAALMALLKIARLAVNPEHTDSWVDLCGYGACGGEIATKVKSGSPGEKEDKCGLESFGSVLRGGYYE